MKDYHFSDTATLYSYLENDINDIAEHELVVFEFSPKIASNDIQSVLPTLIKKTTQFWLKIDTANENFNEKISLAISLGINNICLKMPLCTNTEINLNPAVLRYYNTQDRSQTVKDFINIRNQNNSIINFSCELVLNKNNMDSLYPTLYFFESAGLKWIFLNSDQLHFTENIEAISNVMIQLRMNKKTSMQIYFSPSHPHAENWNNRTENLLSGPQIVDIDVSNSCTHNCVFCGLYTTDNISRLKSSNNGKLSSEVINLMSAKIDRDDCLHFINSIPDSTKCVQFGGLGDPFTHQNIVEFLTACRKRNFLVTCLTNFSYMNENILNELHTLTSNNSESLSFLVNLSAANAKSYTLNRPNQKESTFQKIIEDLKYTQKLRERDGYGITFTLMSVTNKLNYKDMPELVALAKDVNAEKVWIKPVELHSEEVAKYLIPAEERFEYARLAKLVLLFAKKINVNIYMPEVLETLIEKHSGLLADYEKHTSIDQQFEVLCSQSNLIKKYYNNGSSDFTKNYKTKNLQSYHQPVELTNNVTPTLYSSLPMTQVNVGIDTLAIGVNNGDVPSDFYDRLPCKVGHMYIRVEVQGDVRPCCISDISLDNIKGKSLKDIWLSDSMHAFRDKTSRISTEKFHRTDPEWFFCQQCPHIEINKQFHASRGIKL